MSRILTLVLLVEGVAGVHAQAPGPAFDEYQVKAAFLYNFAKFVDWPPGTFTSSSEPIEICIAGHDSLASTLEEMVQGKKIGERAFAVRRLSNTQQAGACKILFIGASEQKRTRGLLAALGHGEILTVGETDDFAALGGVITLKLDGTRVRIQVAIETARQQQFRISSKLLSLAEIVKRQP